MMIAETLILLAYLLNIVPHTYMDDIIAVNVFRWYVIELPSDKLLLF